MLEYIREITSRPGWTNASAMRFVLLSTDSTAPNVYVGYEDYSANASKAATLAVNPAVPTIVSSGAWGTGVTTTYTTGVSVGPFVYPGASTLLLFLGDYYNFYGKPIPQPTVTDECGNTWNILAGPTNWAGFYSPMRALSTMPRIRRHALPALRSQSRHIKSLYFCISLAIAGSDTVNAPIVSAITSPSPDTSTTSATSNSITLTQAGLLVSWIFGNSDSPHRVHAPGGLYYGFEFDAKLSDGGNRRRASPGSCRASFRFHRRMDGNSVIIGLQAP